MLGCLQECCVTRLLPQRTGCFFNAFKAIQSLSISDCWFTFIKKACPFFVIVTLHLKCILVTVASGTKALRQPPLSVFFTSDVSNVYMFVVILFTLSAQGLNQFIVILCHGSDCFSDSVGFSLYLLCYCVHTAQILMRMRLRLH